MALHDIRQPADLRELSYPELDDLAGEIRDFIVQAVAENAGHLGSNLGVVELTLALHRVFDSPTDAILWDTGHQAYVHKIVTGRQAGFEQLRQAGGLSGYPNREESPHDFIENSHASHRAVATPTAWRSARDAGTDPHRHIVAVIGDGCMTGGMAYEALNNIGHSRQRVIIVLNDNGRSYAPTITNLTAGAHRPRAGRWPTTPACPTASPRSCRTALTNIRLNPVYVRRQRRLEQFLRDLPYVGPQAEKSVEAFKAAVREFLQPPSFFEALGVRYVGPVDGHDIEELEESLPQRDRAVGRGPDRRARAHPEGPRLPAGRGRRREAPARRAGVRPDRRPAAGGGHRVHAGVRRGDHQGSRGRPARRGHHRGDARAHRAAAVPGPLPRPLLRRRHRRAARRHRRRRHGHGRPAARRRHLLHVPQPGVGPGGVRRRAAPAAGGLLPRPRRHHRPRRRQPPRRVRHGAAGEGAGHARARAVERRGAAGRCCTTRSRWPTKARSPSAGRAARRATSASTRSASGCTPARLRKGDGSVCILAIGKMVADAQKAAETAGRRPASTPRCGTCAVRAARPGDDRRRRAPRRRVTSRTASATAASA